MLPAWFITCQIVEMCVHMCCAGCEKKIRKAVEKLEGAYVPTSFYT